MANQQSSGVGLPAYLSNQEKPAQHEAQPTDPVRRTDAGPEGEAQSVRPIHARPEGEAQSVRRATPRIDAEAQAQSVLRPASQEKEPPS